VSVNAVDRYLETFEAKDSSESATTRNLLLHLGVHEGVLAFQLELCAYNNQTFRIPDNDGLQLSDVLISESLAMDAPLHSTFPINNIISEMQIKNASASVNASVDPGRYICNYSTCTSSLCRSVPTSLPTLTWSSYTCLLLQRYRSRHR
jgi:pyrrolidone-carboxylate peptidase